MYRNIDEIKRKNEEIGHHLFSRGSMRIFDGRVHAELYGGRYFVTSEKPAHGPRAYAVRKALDSGAVETVGMICQYRTRAQAHAAAKRHAEQGTFSARQKYAAEHGYAVTY